MTTLIAPGALKKEINLIKQHSLLSAPAVSLLAASKTQPVDAIERLISSGIKDFGENRVQEAEAKWPALKEKHPDIRLHLIGPLQSNKVRAALALFDVIQTLDRPKLAEVIAKEYADKKRFATSRIPVFAHSFFIQVNTGAEPQKSGVLPQDLPALLAYCRARGLAMTGLMCIPPAEQPPAPHFALLRKLAAAHGLSELSMGMSEDYAEAIRMGSTCVRLGRALFGERLS